MSTTGDPRRRRFEGINRGRRGRFQLDWFRADPGASRPWRHRLGFVLQLALAAGATTVGVAAFFPLAWERQPSPCAAVESMVWRRTLGAVRVDNGARPTFHTGVTTGIVPDGPLPLPVRCALAYWRRF